MIKKKNPSFSKTILNLLIKVPTLFGLVGKIASLTGIEARIASRSLIHIILLSIISAILLASAWLCALAMLFVALVTIPLSVPWSLFILMMLNFMLLLVTILFLTNFKKKLLFLETRQRIQHALSFYEDL